MKAATACLLIVGALLAETPRWAAGKQIINNYTLPSVLLLKEQWYIAVYFVVSFAFEVYYFSFILSNFVFIFSFVWFPRFLPFCLLSFFTIFLPSSFPPYSSSSSLSSSKVSSSTPFSSSGDSLRCYTCSTMENDVTCLNDPDGVTSNAPISNCEMDGKVCCMIRRVNFAEDESKHQNSHPFSSTFISSLPSVSSLPFSYLYLFFYSIFHAPHTFHPSLSLPSISSLYI